MINIGTKANMNKTDKSINDLIESEDFESFNNHTVSGKTRILMMQVLHMAAREDMCWWNGGSNQVIDTQFTDLLTEYRESVRGDLKPLVEDVQKTGFAI